jgi:SP family facilitated glucose transporter-like MFS transporter 3
MQGQRNKFYSSTTDDDKDDTDMSRFADYVVLQSPPHSSTTVTLPLICATVCATTCQLLVGYHTSVLNAVSSGSIIVFQDDGQSSSTLWWSAAVSAMPLGGPLGAWTGGRLADQYGRKLALQACSIIFLMAGILQTMAWDMATIIVSRLVIGVASGCSSVLVPVYLGELAPSHLKGRLGTLTQLSMVVGILAADLLAFGWATPTQWRLLFALTPVLATIQLCLAPFLLESPRWLLSRNAQSLEARRILQRLRGLQCSGRDLEADVQLLLVGSSPSSSKSTSAILLEMWAQPKVRWLLLSAILLQISQQFSGINAVFYYSTSFFDGVLDNPLVGTALVGALNVLATYAALFLMDLCGRKTLILYSSTGMLVSCLVIVSSLLGYLSSNLWALAAVCTYVTFFALGLGPIPWLIVAELFDGQYVATAMSAASQVNWIWYVVNDCLLESVGVDVRCCSLKFYERLASFASM